MVFFRITKLFLPAACLFSRYRLRGTRGTRRTRRCKCGLGRPPWHVLWAFSREVWQVTTGSLSAELEPGKTMENPRISFFFSTRDARTTLASSFPRSCSDGHYYACVDIAYAYVCCVSGTRVRVCGSVHLFAGNPHLTFFVFCLLCLLMVAADAVRIMSVFLHLVTATGGASVRACVCVLCFLKEH